MEPEPEAEPSPGAGALIKSEAPKKAPDGPKMGGSGEKAPALAPEHCILYQYICFWVFMIDNME